MNQDILSAQADNEAPRILVQGTRYPDVVVANHGSDDDERNAQPVCRSSVDRRGHERRFTR